MVKTMDTDLSGCKAADMKIYAKVCLCLVVWSGISSPLCCAAEQKNAEAGKADDEINMLLKENLNLRRNLFPNDSDVVSNLKKDNEKIREKIERRKRRWEREISAGANVTRGNSDITKVNIGIKGKYKKEKITLNLNADGDYGESEGKKNLERLSGESQFNYNWGRKSFWFVVGTANHDDMASLDYRLVVSPGMGYKIISTDKPNLSVEIGPAYMAEQYRNESGDGYIAIRLGQKLEYIINQYSKVTQQCYFLTNVSNIEDTIIHAEIAVESVLTKRLNLRITLKDDFVNRPGAEAEKNDLYLISSLVLKL